MSTSTIPQQNPKQKKTKNDIPDFGGLDISSIDESVTTSKSTTKNFIVYIVQLLVLTFVILVALFNLTMGWHKDNKDMWVAMLSSCIGYMLPAPSYKKKCRVLI